MASGLLGCGHSEDEAKRKEFWNPGNWKHPYTHLECVRGDVEHASPPGVYPPARGEGRPQRVEDFCPTCQKPN